MTKRTFILAAVVLGALVLGLWALLLEPEALEARTREPAPPSAMVTPQPLRDEGPTQAALEPLPAPPPAAVEIWTGPPPPAPPANQQARTDQLLQLRKQRRTDGMNQLNERQAARRARLGLSSK